MLFELARVFLRLGATSFGGPLAHIALMRREFVEERGWMSDAEFLDLNGAVNLIPGPNSTELAMHIGYKRGKIAGLWVAGACFILPAAILVMILAALYARYGFTPQSQALLRGVSPVVVAIVAQALLKFAPPALKTRAAQGIAALSLVASALGASEIAIIFAAALVGLFLARRQDRSASNAGAEPEKLRKIGVFWLILPAPLLATQSGAIFWAFLKIGSIIYGSGYVLLAYMRADFVEKLGWVTDRQLLDAVAIGQFTPGPLFTSATFIGYQIGGFWGGLAATAGIFLPPFLLVSLLAKHLEKWSGTARARAFLDCVNAASLALMFLVTLQLARAAFWPGQRVDFLALFLGLGAAVLLWKTRLNPALILGLGGAVGWLAARF